MKQSTKSKAVFRSLLLSIVLMIFPVASGVIAVINDMGTVQRYWTQGFFMLLSITVPAIYLWITKTKWRQLGFAGLERGSVKTVVHFVPAIAAKIGYLVCGINTSIHTIVALVFFTVAVGLSEEIYFRGIILRRLLRSFTVKQTIILSSVFFAAVHASQALSGAGTIAVVLTVINAFVFGIVASEIVIITKSIIPVILWHALFDFINWIALAKGTAEVIVIIIQSVIITLYAGYLWVKLPDKWEQ